MNSPFSNLYEQIMLRIKDQVQSVRYINQELGQLENYSSSTGRPAVTYPCVLIDLDSFSTSDLGGNAQSLEGEVVIRLALDTWSNASSLASAETREKSLKYFDVEFDIYQAISSWSPDSLYNEDTLIAHFSTLARIAVSTEKREDGIRVRVMRFKAEIEDYSATDKARIAIAQLEIING